MSDKMREALEALRRARDKAMFQTVKTPIPLCAEFADIAQDVAYAIVALAEQPAQGDAVAEIHPAVTNGRNTSRVFAALLDAARDLPVGTKLYTAPPAPSVIPPDALRESYGCNPSYINGWNACRAAMLAASGDAQ